MEHFVTGSSLLKDVEPGDVDIVCQVKDYELLDLIQQLNPEAVEGSRSKDGKFKSLRIGKYNYICTTNPEYFYRFKAYSGLLMCRPMRGLEDKARRVNVAKACIDTTVPGLPAKKQKVFKKDLNPFIKTLEERCDNAMKELAQEFLRDIE
jgi:hypothetical protein